MKTHCWWQIQQNPEETEQAYNELITAQKNKDNKTLFSVIKKPGLVRSFVVRRGSNNKYLTALIDLYQYFFQNCGSVKNIILLLQKNELPEYLIWEWLSSSFRLKNETVKNQLINSLKISINLIKNNSVAALLIHEIGTWMAEQEKKYSSAIDFNKQALSYAKKGEDKLVLIRIKFGLSIHKGKIDNKKLSSKKMITDLTQYRQKFHNYNDFADELRADFEINLTKFLLATVAKDKEKLFLIKESAKKIQQQAREFAYPNLLIITKELLGLIDKKLGQEKSAKKYFKEAQKLRFDFNYKNNSDLLTG